nr:hypothetical protein Iba_chr05bCG6070 [Ipomoea batatas]
MRGGGDAVGDGGTAAVTEYIDRTGAEKPCLEGEGTWVSIGAVVSDSSFRFTFMNASGNAGTSDGSGASAYQITLG